MNKLNLAVALAGTALLAPCAKASGVVDPAGPFEGANTFALAETDFPLYVPTLALDTEAYMASVIAEITAAIERTTETAELQASLSNTTDADAQPVVEVPFYDDAYWDDSYEIPVGTLVDAPIFTSTFWETTIYESPFVIELTIGVDQPYGPATFEPNPMIVDLAPWGTHVGLDPVLLMEVRARF